MDSTINKFDKLVLKLLLLTGLIQLYFGIAILYMYIYDFYGWAFTISAIIFFTLSYLLKNNIYVKYIKISTIVFTVIHLIWWFNLYKYWLIDMISIVTGVDKLIQVLIIILLLLTIKK